MIRSIQFIAFCALLPWASAFAQPPEQTPGPTKEHQWLAQFVGEWQTQSDCTRGPGEAPIKCEGAVIGRKLGEFWIVNEINSTMLDTPINAIQTIGYDPVQKKYIGTWVDSMMNHMWKYEGTVDQSGKILTLEADGPNPGASGKPTKFRDSYEFKTPDRILAKSSMLGDDGKWVTFMIGEMKRKK